jgi:hypothetical protein
VSDVVRDQRASQSHGMRSDQDIELPDRPSSFGQYAANSSELRCRSLIERHNFNSRRECVDERMESL